MSKQILSIFISFFGLLFLVVPVFAQSDQEIAKKYGITFPIAELGNCASIDECKTFCDNPDNYQKCTDFAKQHNLVSTDSTNTTSKTDAEILELAKVELDCSTMDECMAFCNKEENMEKCIDFAARHGLGGGNADQMRQVISSLKQLFGCSSMTSCMDTCNQPDNQQKCMEVFKQAGFPVEASYSGPGGCNSEESCRSYCEKNPKECGADNFQQEPPEVWCSKVASDCKWDGTTCICGGASSPQEPGEVWCPKISQYCIWDGSSCTCWDDCIKAGGVWTGSRCDLPQETGEVWCPKAGPGCSWNGQQCTCPGSESPVESGTSQPTPESGEVWCPRNPGCQWTGDTCLCEAVIISSTPEPSPSPTVQGTSTNRGLLQQILDFILRR